MHRRYARSLRGTRAEGQAPVNYGPNHSVIGAIRLDEIVTALTFEGATDGNAFKAFTTHFLAPKIKPGDIVIMDNLSAHKVDGIRATIENAGAELLYLPSYSPDFNPIELCWSKFKHWIRTIGARTKEALYLAMAQSFDRITSNDLKGWFNHCGYGLLN